MKPQPGETSRCRVLTVTAEIPAGDRKELLEAEKGAGPECRVGRRLIPPKQPAKPVRFVSCFVGLRPAWTLGFEATCHQYPQPRRRSQR